MVFFVHLFNLSILTHDTCDRQITKESYTSITYIYITFAYIYFRLYRSTKALLQASGIPITRARSRNVNDSEVIEIFARSSPSKAEVDVGNFRKKRDDEREMKQERERKKERKRNRNRKRRNSTRRMNIVTCEGTEGLS